MSDSNNVMLKAGISVYEHLVMTKEIMVRAKANWKDTNLFMFTYLQLINTEHDLIGAGLDDLINNETNSSNIVQIKKD